MSNPATFDQAYQMLNLVREAGTSLRTLQALYATGLLSDLLKMEDPEEVNREEFQQILGLNPSVFRIKMGGPETTDKVVTYLKANGFNYVSTEITQKNFPLTKDPVVDGDEIVIYDPDTGFSEDSGLAILKREGLRRPTYQHALRFAREYGTATTSKKKPYIIFLHKPWWDGPGYNRLVLCIRRHPSDRKLHLDCPDYGFGDHCVLAGIRPRK
jgi:hypothetical protein